MTPERPSCGTGSPLSSLERVYGHAIVDELRRRVAEAGGAPVDSAWSRQSSTARGQAVVDRVHAVPAPLAAALPRGGLAGGTVVGLRGDGATSLLFALLSATPGSWSALVALPDLGLLAAAELGVDLDRVVVVPEPGPELLQVISILVDGVDVVVAAVAPGVRPAPGRLRVLGGRLRQRGAVLLTMGAWPESDLVLTSSWRGFTGLGDGHGRLLDRELLVEVSGRGVGRPRQAVLSLRASRDAVRIVAGDPAGVRPGADRPAVAAVG